MAGSVWTNFTAGNLIKASEVNENLDWLEGTLMPQTAGSQTNNAYDIGSSTYKWRTGYFGTSVFIGSNLDLNGTTLTTSTIGKVDGTSLEVSTGIMSVKSGGITQSTQSSSFLSNTHTNTGSSVTITTTGGKVLLIAEMLINTGTSNFCIERSGTVVTNSERQATAFYLSGMVIDSPSASSYTYRLMYDVGLGGTLQSSNVIAIELKK